MILYVIRHGKTEANDKKLYCGKTDSSLSKEGRRLLYEKKGMYSDKVAQVYIISGLRRTKETLDILFGEQEYLVFSAFEEMNFGRFEMKSYEELKEREDYQKWIRDIEHETCPLGESQEIFRERIKEGWRQIEELCYKKQYETVVLITHGGVIAQLMELLFKEGKHLYEWQPNCGQGYAIELSGVKRSYDKIESEVIIKLSQKL